MREGYHRSLLEKAEALRVERVVYPPQERVLFALEAVAFDDVKVVIVGQDPYHGPGQANGLAFSVPELVKAPPSLRNIFKEIADDIYGGSPPERSTDLSDWAHQGVLLLNASLTVERGAAGSHRDLGWIVLTDDIIARLSAKRDYLVFLLWGRYAQSKRGVVDESHHLVLEASHPSPLSAYRGFFGCRHFSRANAYLVAHSRSPIVW
ncbi:MAG: uracil-DNA glycosylase [Anaerolineae bacterium]|nr:uracil-DNA glycosylase [Anaerolineae bacterium]